MPNRGREHRQPRGGGAVGIAPELAPAWRVAGAAGSVRTTRWTFSPCQDTGRTIDDFTIFVTAGRWAG